MRLREALRWSLSKGKNLDLLFDAAEDEDVVVAESAIEALESRPELQPDQTALLRWFTMCSRGRPSSFSNLPAPLPTSELESFYRMMQLADWLPPDEFFETMVFLDRELIEFYRERLPKKPLADGRRK